MEADRTGNARKERAEVPAGYRYVYGQLEKIPEPVTEAAPWEQDYSNFEPDEAYMKEAPKGRRYRPVTPDGTTIDAEGKTYATVAEALNALCDWCKRYKQQGGYRTGRGEFIPYVDLWEECNVEPIDRVKGRK